MTRPPLHFGILMPTFHRPTLLRRAVRGILEQSYPHWTLAVVHDGPQRREEYPFDDGRIRFFQTSTAARDYGLTPRLLGAERLDSESPAPDYMLCWDDDNRFFPDSLERIAALLEQHRFPHLLLVPLWLAGRTLPAGEGVGSLRHGEVDSANLVVEWGRGIAALRRLKGRGRVSTDYLLFKELVREAGFVGARATGRPVGVYDGGRPLTWWSWRLGLPMDVLYRWRPHRLLKTVRKRLLRTHPLHLGS